MYTSISIESLRSSLPSLSAYKVLKTMAQRSMAMFVAVLPLIIRVECDDGPTSCGPTNACCPTKDPLGMAEYEIIW